MGRNLLKSTSAVAAVMLLSKVLGFFRQSIIANVYGSNIATDTYFISSEFMINLSAAFTTALTTALVTVYISIAMRESKQAAGKVASRVLSLFLLGAAVLVILLDVFSAEVGRILAPAYTAQEIQVLAHYLRLFSAAFLFSAFQSIYAAVQNANDIFIPGKLYGVIYNPITIFFMLAFGEKLGLSALVYAYYVANVIQVVLLHVRCRGLYTFTPALNFRDERVRQVWRLALPVLLSNVVIQLNGVVDKAICSYLGAGMASSYTYANTLEQFVTGTFTATINLILLSRFAEIATEGDQEKMNRTLTRAATLMVLILAPVAIITVFSAGDIVSLVYYRGEFTLESVHSTTLALVGFALGFPVIALRELLIRVHFAYQRTRGPMVISMVSVVFNIVMSIVLSLFMGVLGVTLATSLSAVLSVILLNRDVKKLLPQFRLLAQWKSYGKCAVSTALAVGAVLAVAELRISSVLVRTACKLFAGCAVYFVGIVLLHYSAVKAFVAEWRARHKKK
ncbi:MAG: lipid II flippase MurJ [Evtepia sp.]|uniref:murein biosynthesis integral membrane protein MurJ n=1 Tax=Evtepia sp. TaxID=2773933 RepID=UPI002A760C84|nr:lipid II flippase MurJ [Evtepia sp.]MDY3014102.1 lipid II flippase MurJ [Evtepia sp.]